MLYRIQETAAVTKTSFDTKLVILGAVFKCNSRVTGVGKQTLLMVLARAAPEFIIEDRKEVVDCTRQSGNDRGQ